MFNHFSRDFHLTFIHSADVRCFLSAVWKKSSPSLLPRVIHHHPARPYRASRARAWVVNNGGWVLSQWKPHLHHPCKDSCTRASEEGFDWSTVLAAPYEMLSCIVNLPEHTRALLAFTHPPSPPLLLRCIGYCYPCNREGLFCLLHRFLYVFRRKFGKTMFRRDRIQKVRFNADIFLKCCIFGDLIWSIRDFTLCKWRSFV